MIRFANKFDNDAIIGLMKDFAETSKIPLTSNPLLWSKTYIESVLTHLYAGQGFVLIDEAKTGILIAAKVQCFWIKEVLQLQEVMLHSNNPIVTLRLIKEYARIGREMMAKNEITQAVICSFKDDGFERLGMKKLEIHWGIE
jgi:hypothetical protein